MDRIELGPARWTLAHAHGDAPGAVRAAGPIPAAVPGCVHTDLLAAGLIEDPHGHGAEARLAWIGRCDWRYECRFDWSGTAHERVDLACDGLDTLATLTLNGFKVGRSANMHRRHRFEVGGAIREGTNVLAIAFAAPVTAAEVEAARLGNLPRVRDLPYNFIRKMASSFSWDWGPAMPTSGVWRAIAIEAWSGGRLGDVVPAVTLEGGDARLDVRVAVKGTGRVEGVLRDPDGREVARASADAAGEAAPGAASLALDVPSAALWWPRGYGDQPLHHLTVTLADGTRTLDERTHRIGLRTIAVDRAPDALGHRFGLVVNARPVRVRGANWIPDDTLPARVTHEDVVERIGQATAMGANALRVWGGGIYPDDAFFDACDEAGVLVWQDFAFACADYPEAEPHRSEVAAEARDVVARLARHPSLALWCGGNESVWLHDAPEEADAEGRTWATQVGDRAWGLGYYAGVLPEAVAQVDPGRPYLPNSPWSPDGGPPNDEANGPVHLWREWNAAGPDRYRDHRPAFAAEWGHAGPPNWATLTARVPPEGRTPLSPHMDYRIRAADGQVKLHDRLREMFAIPHDPDRMDFTDWHFLAQLAQARAVRTGIEWLRAVERCAGTMVWQLNDCWPVTSWALVDGAGAPKPAWHAARAAHADRLLTIQPRGKLDGTDAPGLDAVLVNDTDEAWLAEGRARRLDFGGGERGAQSFARDVAPRSVARIALAETLWRADAPQRELIVADAAGAARADWFHRPDRALDYPEPLLEARIDGDAMHVTARSLVRELMLRPDMVRPDWRVDRGPVTLLPGESATFRVRSASPDRSVALDRSASPDRSVALDRRAASPPVLSSASRFGLHWRG